MILPIIQGSLQDEGMPAVPMPPADGLAVAAFIRSVLETIGGQGTPPQVGKAAPSVLVGNAKEGQAYFAAKCAGCHTPTGDLNGIATRVADPRDLQTAWVSGEARDGRVRDPNARAVKVTIAAASGERVEGRLLHIDDFLVTVRLADGTVQSFERHGEIPAVKINDPMQGHRDLLTQYTDRDIHDVTAFLATLK